MQRILALDYGKKRIGVAISDKTNKIALGHKVIINSLIEESIFEISKIIETNKIKLLIIGVPLGLRNVISNQTQETLDFIEKLEKNIKIKIEKVDERYTSKLADTFLKDKKKIKIGERDIISAKIMLQDYLDKINNL